MVKVKEASLEQRREKEILEQMVEKKTAELKRNHSATLNLMEDLIEENDARKKSEIALTESESRLKDIIYSMGEWVWEIDENGLYTYSSTQGSDLLGYTNKEIIGKSPFYFMLPEEATRLGPIVSGILEKKEIIVDLENWNFNKNGEQICLLTNGVPILDKDGILKGYRGVDKDITKRKIAEEEIITLNSNLDLKVKQRTNELSKANSDLANKNREMSAGIKYAGRIQKSIFDHPDAPSKHFKETFTFFKPKDFVSGDFLFFYTLGDISFIAAVDCTGHGVPGALLSMVAYQFIKQIIVEEECHEPSEILNKLDKKLIEAIHQYSDDIVRDGMDISLCRIDKSEKKIMFSGACLPLFYFNGKELIEIKGSKNTIGGFIHSNDEKYFGQTELAYKEGVAFSLVQTDTIPSSII